MWSIESAVAAMVHGWGMSSTVHCEHRWGRERGRDVFPSFMEELTTELSLEGE